MLTSRQTTRCETSWLGHLALNEAFRIGEVANISVKFTQFSLSSRRWIPLERTWRCEKILGQGLKHGDIILLSTSIQIFAISFLAFGGELELLWLLLASKNCWKNLMIMADITDICTKGNLRNTLSNFTTKFQDLLPCNREKGRGRIATQKKRYVKWIVLSWRGTCASVYVNNDNSCSSTTFTSAVWMCSWYLNYLVVQGRLHVKIKI